MAERTGPPPTRHGQPLALVASALQKAIRRADEETALRAVAELDASGFTAYAWFRLLTIASEDVGLADSNVAVQVNALHDAALKAQKRPRGDGTMQLIHATLLLVRARKSRIVDHAVIAMYADPQPTPISDVAIDKHTLEGRRRGRGWEHFWSEGTLLADRETGELSPAPDIEDRYDEDVTLNWDLDDPTVVALLDSHVSNASSAAVQRLNELTEEKRARLRDEQRPPRDEAD